jgi:glycosyltransferase involved in cell wall biosynthesis
MRIAMLSPISWRTPPRHYGPWEFVTSLLTEALVARGLDVTLFATADSQTSAKLAAVCPRPCSENESFDHRTWELIHIAHVFERADEFDLIHNQADFAALAFAKLVETPVVTTIHGFSSPRILPIFERYNDRAHYVAISEADRSPRLRYAATIHHGIRLGDFPFNASGGDDLLFYARIHPDKGAVEAIETARLARRRLIMAGIVHDQHYFRESVQPEIDGDKAVYLGSVGGGERARILGNALALLHLANFEEPFGLSVVEALACGTPVIAFKRGALPELIEHGVTGFLVDTVEEAAECVERAVNLDRAACRAAAEERFSVDRMADDYVRLYRRIVGQEDVIARAI